MTPTTKTKSGFRVSLFAGLAIGALATATAVTAQTAHAIHIPAGPLDAALISLAAQTHEQILYTPRLAAGRTSPAVDGDLTAEQALARMVRPSEIVVSRTGPSIVVLRAAIPPGATVSAARISNTAQDTAGGRPFTSEAASPLGATTTARPLDQGAPPTPATVSEVEVTGTHIRGVTDSPSPVQVISRTDLDTSGYQTVAEALATLPQNFTGAGTETTAALATDRSSGNSFYATGVNLRGLGPNATLTLIDGHRLAGSGLNADFADLSTLPSVAVERVEVLLDGASALYGSDAVGGVINVIMRRNFNGAETRASQGWATEGSAPEFQVSQLFGRTWKGGGLTVALEHDQRGDLLARDRSFSQTGNLKPQGGTDHRLTFSHPGNILAVNPATGLSTFYAIPAGQTGTGLTAASFTPNTTNLEEPLARSALLPRQVTDSVYGRLSQSLGDRLDLSADITLGRRRFQLPTGSIFSSFTVSRANPFFVSPTGANSETIEYAFDDLPSEQLKGVTEDLATTIGADLRLPRDWQMSAYAGFAQDHSRTAQTGLLNSTALSEALGNTADNPATSYSAARDGFYNPFGAGSVNSTAVDGFIGEGFSTSDTRDRVTSGDVKFDGALFSLPAGPLRVAFGGDVRHEAFARSGQSFTSGVTPTASSPLAFSRNVSAAYAELRAPLLAADGAAGALDLSVAGRFEHYSDFGSTSNPKVGLIWTPSSDLHVRASWGTSFRAPSLPQLFGQQFFTPNRLPAGAAGSLLVVELQGGNPTLRPETATSWSFGFDYAPARVPGLKIAASWFDTDYTHRIDQPVRAVLGTALTDPAYASFVSFVSPSSNATDLARIQALLAAPQNLGLGANLATAYRAIVDARYVNTGSLHVSGLDAQASYWVDAGATHLNFSANAAYLNTYDLGVTPNSATIHDLNVANFPVRFRGRATASASRGLFTGQIALNYVNAYKGALGQDIDAHLTTDLQIRAAAPENGALAGLSATLSVRNLFDRKPPFYDSPAGVAFDPANGDPIGRFVAFQLIKAW